MCLATTVAILLLVTVVKNHYYLRKFKDLYGKYSQRFIKMEIVIDLLFTPVIACLLIEKLHVL